MHQAKNCALVLGVMEILKEQGQISVSDEIIRKAMSRIQCPARVELVGRNPFIILDYAHTVDSMRSLKNALLENFTFKKLILILGFSQDKDLDNILKEIVPAGNSIIVTRSTNPRAAPPEDLSHRIEKLYNRQPRIADNAQDAVTLGQRDCLTGRFDLYHRFRLCGRRGIPGARKIPGKISVPVMLCILFCRPFGAGYLCFFTRGFTPGYILSALRACCRAKRLFALREKVAKGLILLWLRLRRNTDNSTRLE